jgi:hypothetical protein
VASPLPRGGWLEIDPARLALTCLDETAALNAAAA